MKALLVFQLRRPPVKDSSPKLQAWPAHPSPTFQTCIGHRPAAGAESPGSRVPVG